MRHYRAAASAFSVRAAVAAVEPHVTFARFASRREETRRLQELAAQKRIKRDEAL